MGNYFDKFKSAGIPFMEGRDKGNLADVLGEEFFSEELEAGLEGIDTNLLLRPLLTKGLHLVGSMLRNRTPQFKAYILSELVAKVWPKIEDGTIKPSIYKVLPMAQAEEAHAILQRNENVGKVVLSLN